MKRMIWLVTALLLLVLPACGASDDAYFSNILASLPFGDSRLGPILPLETSFALAMPVSQPEMRQGVPAARAPAPAGKGRPVRDAGEHVQRILAPPAGCGSSSCAGRTGPRSAALRRAPEGSGSQGRHEHDQDQERSVHGLAQ